MKRFITFSFVLFSLLLFGEDFYTLKDIPYFKKASTSSSNVAFTNFSPLSNDFYNAQLNFLSTYHGLRYKTASGTLGYSPSSSFASSPSYDTALYNLTSSGYVKFANCPLIVFVDGILARSLFEGFVPAGPSNIGGAYQYVGQDSNFTYINVNSFKFLSQMITSTNTVFRSYAVSTLSSINNYLSSINSSFSSLLSNSSFGVSSFQDFLASYNLINGLLISSSTNFNSTSFLGTLPGIGFSSDGAAVADFLDSFAPDLSPSDRSSFLSSFRSASDNLLSSALQAHSLDPSHSFESYLSSPALSSGVISKSNSGHYVTPLTNELQRINTNWVEQAKKQLADNTQSIKDQLAGDHVSTTNFVKQLLTGDGVKIQDGASVAVLNDRFMVDVMNWPSEFVFSFRANDMDVFTSGFKDINDQLDELKEKWDDWFDKWQVFVDQTFSLNFASNNTQLAEINSKLSNINSWTNILVMSYDYMTNSLATNSLASSSSSFDTLLLSDYYDFVTNNHYQSFLDHLSMNPDIPFDSSFSDILTDYNVFDTSSGSGNFWRFFTANQAILGSAAVNNHHILSFFYSNLVSTLSFADNNFEGGYLSQAQNVISNYPSVEEAESQILSVTQAVYSAAAGFEDVYSTLGSTSNQYVTSVSGLYLDRSLPDSISLSLIPDHPFSIPVSEFSDLWNLLRIGIAFAISIVNLILLPKFILKLFSLFFGVYDAEVRISNSEHHT